MHRITTDQDNTEVLSHLCYYDKRNPECSMSDEDIEDHKSSLDKKSKKLGYDKGCSCDNCFYGRTKLAEHILALQEQLVMARINNLT